MRKKVLSIVFASILTVSTLAMPTTVARAEDFKEVKAVKIACQNDLGDATLQSTATGSISMKSDKTTTDDYFMFQMPEDGIASFQFSLACSKEPHGSNLEASFTVFSNKEMSVAVVPETILDTTGYKITRAYLKKGTYYIKCDGYYRYTYDLGDATSVVGVAVGYLPLEGSAKDFDIKLSTTKTVTGPVVLNIETNDPDARVYVEKGAINESLMGNIFTWGPDNQCSDKTYTVAENGVYTVLIMNSIGQFAQKGIHITNIDTTKPMTPSVETKKIGTKKIEGKADAGTKVYCIYNKKTYTTIALDDGSYSITTAKLAKGKKIVLYAQDVAGNKSQKRTVTLK